MNRFDIRAAGWLAAALLLPGALQARDAQIVAERVGDVSELRAAPAAAPTRAAPLPAGALPLFDNGPLVTHPGAGPGGTDHSRLQSDSLSMTIFGFGHNIAANIRLSEDFVVTGGGWDIDSFTFYTYQTGSTTTSTITRVVLQIWDGPPNVPGSTVVFGDLSTNRLVSSTFSNNYRVTEDNTGDTTRPIMRNTVAADVTLPPGDYWVEWGTAGSLGSGPWAPPITILGQTTTGDALQFNGGWVNVFDGSFPQGIPFQVHGTELATGGPILGADWVQRLGNWALVDGNPIGNFQSNAGTARYESISHQPSSGRGSGSNDFYYTVELRATRPNQVTAANSIFLAGTPTPLQSASQWWNTGIAFNFAANGKYSIFRYNGANKPVALQTWTTPVGTSVFGSGQQNLLGVEYIGGTLTFYLNEVPVKTISGFVPQGSEVGVGMVRSIPAVLGAPNADTLEVLFAEYGVPEGRPAGAVRPSTAQEANNAAANRLLPNPDPQFAPQVYSSGSRN